MKTKKISFMAIIGLLVFILPMMIYAYPIPAAGTEGNQVIVSGNGPVIATYEGQTADYSNDLYLALALNDVFIFNNHTSLVGSTANLGTFDIGTELIFKIFVNNTQYSFFTGPASRNPDQEFHARVEALAGGVTLVGFEDIYGGGDRDYDDLVFSFTNTNTSVPEPATMLLLGLGLVGLAGLRRKR